MKTTTRKTGMETKQLRISKEVHKQLAYYALEKDTSMIIVAENAIMDYISTEREKERLSNLRK